MSLDRITSGLAVAGIIASCMIGASAQPSGNAPPPPAISPSPSATPRIRSKSDLEAYLRETAQSGSPFDALSPHGRKRFFAMLAFTDRGVAGCDFADLRAQLERAQVEAILSLIGMQQFTADVAAAAPEPGVKDSGAPDELLDHYDVFVTRPEDPNTRDSHALESDYLRWFTPSQSRARLESLPSSDVHALFRAASIAFGAHPLATYANDMSADLADLRRRSLAADDEYSALFASLLEIHDFDAARKLRADHPTSDMAPVPMYRDRSDRSRTSPTMLTLSEDGTALERRSVDLETQARIVVVAAPGCHFCAAGIHDIEADPLLWPAFKAHALWLMPPSFTGDFPEIAAWNRTHPNEHMTVAYDYDEWPAVTDWSLPNFYIFRDRKLAGHVTGWPSEGNVAALRSILGRLGML